MAMPKEFHRGGLDWAVTTKGIFITRVQCTDYTVRALTTGDLEVRRGREIVKSDCFDLDHAIYVIKLDVWKWGVK